MAKSLLDLPRELRDIIYEYALTEDGGLIVQSLPPDFESLPAIHLEAAGAKYKTDPNQLKFTCRQLYAETIGLSLRYNKLSFLGYSNFELFNRFTRTHCTSAHFKRVKSVYIVQRSQANFYEELREADAIGKAYPNLSIEIRLQWLTERAEFDTWRFAGSRIQCILRGTIPDLYVASVLGANIHVFEDGFGADSRNVQVFPMGFDEETCRVVAISSGRITIDGWMAQFKKWFQEGF